MSHRKRLERIERLLHRDDFVPVDLRGWHAQMDAQLAAHEVGRPFSIVPRRGPEEPSSENADRFVEQMRQLWRNLAKEEGRAEYLAELDKRRGEVVRAIEREQAARAF